MNPTYTNAWNNKADYFWKDYKNMMKQLDPYDKALEIDPRYTNAWNGMGVIQGILGKSPKRQFTVLKK